MKLVHLFRVPALLRALAIPLAILAFGSNSTQASMTIDLDGVGAGLWNVNVNYNGSNVSVFAGQYLMHYASNQRSINSFCVDFSHDVSIGQSYAINPRSVTDGLNNGARIGYLYDAYGVGHMSNNNQAAALQLAIWKLELDNTTDLNAGNFRYSGSLASLVNSFLTEAWNRSGNALWLDASASGDAWNRGQSVLDAAPAPAPATWVMLGEAVACLAVAARFRRRWCLSLAPV